MKHLLRKYDVARFTRNDAMFALISGKADIICHEANIIEKSTSHEVLFFWQGYKDSNLGHSVLETDALPTELHP